GSGPARRTGRRTAFGTGTSSGGRHARLSPDFQAKSGLIPAVAVMNNPAQQAKLRIPAVIAGISCLPVDPVGQQASEQAIARLVGVAPIAWPVERHVGSGLAPRWTRVDEV